MAVVLASETPVSERDGDDSRDEEAGAGARRGPGLRRLGDEEEKEEEGAEAEEERVVRLPLAAAAVAAVAAVAAAAMVALRVARVVVVLIPRSEGSVLVIPGSVCVDTRPWVGGAWSCTWCLKFRWGLGTPSREVMHPPL